MELDKEAIANRIKTFRTSREWSKTKLGKESELTSMGIHYVERGDRLPALLTALKLSKTFEITVEQLILGKENNED